jgi:hypothetical protein
MKTPASLLERLRQPADPEAWERFVALYAPLIYSWGRQASLQDAVDGRCDLFSLGCVLYRMCTGRAPFEGSDIVSTLMAVATETPPAPRALNAEVSPALQALILRLLAKEPGVRPANAHEVIETLAALEGQAAATPTRSSRRLLLAGAAAVPLTGLAFHFTRVSDLAPLKDMPLTTLYCDTTAVSDLSPLAGMPLTCLTCFTTQVSELSPLAGMKLTYLDCASTKVSDLAPLKGMPLTELWCQETTVTDLSPLAGLPLKILWCDIKSERDAAIVRSIKTLEKINDKLAAEFWKEVEAREANRKP